MLFYIYIYISKLSHQENNRSFVGGHFQDEARMQVAQGLTALEDGWGSLFFFTFVAIF